MESLYLAAAVTEEFADPRHARHHLEEDIGIPAFREDFLAFSDLYDRSGGAQGLGIVLACHPGRAGSESRGRGVIAEGLRCHGYLQIPFTIPF